MLWVKAFHIVFVASWFAGLFYLPRIFVNLASVPADSHAERERLLLMARRLYRFAGLLMIPALGLGFVLWLYYGIGRGPGNCCLELLLTFLQNPKFRLRPVLQLIQEHYLPLREKIEWGYLLPYMITGLLDEHPRAAIALRNGPDKDKYKDFNYPDLQRLTRTYRTELQDGTNDNN